jgi:hypothetical protein
MLQSQLLTVPIIIIIFYYIPESYLLKTPYFCLQYLIILHEFVPHNSIEGNVTESNNGPY